MELTGNTLKDFWVWYLLPEQRKTYKTNSLRGGDNVAKIRFLAMSIAERWGVLVDYFDSVGIVIEAYKYSLNLGYGTMIDNDSHTISFPTMDEARITVTEKANELRNKQLNDTIWN